MKKLLFITIIVICFSCNREHELQSKTTNCYGVLQLAINKSYTSLDKHKVLVIPMIYEECNCLLDSNLHSYIVYYNEDRNKVNLQAPPTPVATFTSNVKVNGDNNKTSVNQNNYTSSKSKTTHIKLPDTPFSDPEYREVLHYPDSINLPIDTNFVVRYAYGNGKGKDGIMGFQKIDSINFFHIYVRKGYTIKGWATNGEEDAYEVVKR